MKRFFIFLLLNLFILTVFSQPGVKILSATSQRWAGGISDRGGIKYKVTLIAPASSKVISFDTLWVGDYPLFIEDLFNKDQWVTKFSKGDTLNFNVELTIVSGVYQQKPAVPPVKYSSEAMLQYMYREKYYYKNIDTLEKLMFLAKP